MRSMRKPCWTSKVDSVFSGGVGGMRGKSARTAVVKKEVAATRKSAAAERRAVLSTEYQVLSTDEVMRLMHPTITTPYGDGYRQPSLACASGLCSRGHLQLVAAE